MNDTNFIEALANLLGKSESLSLAVTLVDDLRDKVATMDVEIFTPFLMTLIDQYEQSTGIDHFKFQEVLKEAIEYRDVVYFMDNMDN